MGKAKNPRRVADNEALVLQRLRELEAQSG